jgi:hypothetical protein
MKSKLVRRVATVVAVAAGVYLLVDATWTSSTPRVATTDRVTDSTTVTKERAKSSDGRRSATIESHGTPGATASLPKAKPGAAPRVPVAPTVSADTIRQIREGKTTGSSGPGVRDPMTVVIEAERALAQSDFPRAAMLSRKALEVEPDNVRMRRVAVASACMMGEADVAKQYNAKLALNDQLAMTKRCREHGTPIAR